MNKLNGNELLNIVLGASLLAASGPAMAEKKHDSPIGRESGSLVVNGNISEHQEKIAKMIESCQVSLEKTASCSDAFINNHGRSSSCMDHEDDVFAKKGTFDEIFCEKVQDLPEEIKRAKVDSKKYNPSVLGEQVEYIMRALKYDFVKYTEDGYDWEKLLKDDSEFDRFIALLKITSDIEPLYKHKIIENIKKYINQFRDNFEYPRRHNLFNKRSIRYSDLSINKPWSFLHDLADRAITSLGRANKVLSVLGMNVDDFEEANKNSTQLFLAKGRQLLLSYSKELMQSLQEGDQKSLIERFQVNGNLDEVKDMMNFLDGFYGESTDEEKISIEAFRDGYESYLLKNYASQIQVFRDMESTILVQPFHAANKGSDPFSILESNHSVIESYRSSAIVNIRAIVTDLVERTKNKKDHGVDYVKIEKIINKVRFGNKEIKLLRRYIKKGLGGAAPGNVKSLLMAMERQIENHVRLSSIDLTPYTESLLEASLEQAKKEVYRFAYPSLQIIESDNGYEILSRELKDGIVQKSNYPLVSIDDFMPNRLSRNAVTGTLLRLEQQMPDKKHAKYNEIKTEIEKMKVAIAQKLMINASNSLIYLSQYKEDYIGSWISDHNSMGRGGLSSTIAKLRGKIGSGEVREKFSEIDALRELEEKKQGGVGGTLVAINWILFDISLFLDIYDTKNKGIGANGGVDMENPGRKGVEVLNRKKTEIIEKKVLGMLDKYEKVGGIPSDMIRVLRAAKYLDVNTKVLIGRFLSIEQKREGDNFNKAKLLEKINSMDYLL